MNRLLIVDDEPLIVNSICHLLQEDGLEAEMIRAYNAYEALEAMRRTRIDLVISDIHMPGLSGIEMHERMRKQWPYSQMIFLTGYNEFEYAQRAIQAGGTVDYLLKNQNDEALLAAVRKALEAIEANDSIVQRSVQAAGRLQVALPALQREVLLKALRGELREPGEMRRQLARAEIGLEPERRVALMLARVDEWEQTAASQTADRELLLYACRNIMAEYLGTSVEQAAVTLEDDRLLWIVQPASHAEEPGAAQAEADLLSRLPSIAEAVQEACARWLRVPLSFALAAHPCDWETAGSIWSELGGLLQLGRNRRQLLVRGIRPFLTADEDAGLAEDEAGEGAEGFRQDGAGALPPLIGRLQAYIREHLEADLSLTRLAELAHYSPTYLSRLYKQETGTMLFEYITEQRMGKAKQLLRDSNLRIYEIAEAVGYESAPHLIRFFKKRHGMTPQQYRDLEDVNRKQ